MEQITYRKTLDAHKNGVQFMLQGFETEDKMSRVIEISLMASGDAIDFPLEGIVPMMYVTTPSAQEPSINSCTIKDNKVVYEVLPIREEGITIMQLKLIEPSANGAKRVLMTGRFAVEVTKSTAMDDGPGIDDTFEENDNEDKIKPEFTALENFIAKAEIAYGRRLERIELTSDCIFKAYYADDTTYETDILKRLFYNGTVLIAESYAHGGTGVRAGEDTDNSMYYSNIARSEALNAQYIMQNSEEILEEARLHGVYTAFTVNFKNGIVEYVSPSYDFRIDKSTGELEARGNAYSFEEAIYKVINDWLAENNVVLKDLEAVSTLHSDEISELQELTSTHTTRIGVLEDRVIPVEKGGTGAISVEGALDALGALSFEKHDYEGNGSIGESGQRQYTFKRMPKLIMLCDLTEGATLIFPYGQTFVSFARYGANLMEMEMDILLVTYDDKTISYYGTKCSDDGGAKPGAVTARAGFNVTGYNYAIIGI